MCLQFNVRGLVLILKSLMFNVRGKHSSCIDIEKLDDITWVNPGNRRKNVDKTSK